MRLLLKCLAICSGAAAVVAIAGCGPASIAGLSPAAHVSGVASAPSSAAPSSVTGDAGQVPSSGAISTPVTSPAATPAAVSNLTATALSIVMTLPVHHPAQTTAVIAGQLSEPANGSAPLPGRLVWLQRLGTGGWLLFRSEVTGPDGRVAFGVHVVVGAIFRLAYAGTPSLAPAVSPIRIVTA